MPYCKTCGVEIPEGYLQNLINYDWPGNIRELENVIELIINTESIPVNLGKKLIRPNEDFLNLDEENLKLEFMEKNHILAVMEKFKGNVTCAAKALGVGRNTLYRKLEKYNLEISREK